MKPMEAMRAWLIGAALTALIDYLCFRCWPLLIMAVPGGLFAIARCKRRRTVGRQERLAFQFREMLTVLGGCLEAGYSLEPALRQTESELVRLYGRNSDMSLELHRLNRKIGMNMTAEEAIRDLADRSGLEDIRHFSQVFAVARRGSGGLGQVICSTARTLGRRQRTEEEIQSLLSARRLEQRILLVMPFVLMAYLNFSSPGFLDVMYCTWLGRGIMAGCLLAEAAAWAVSERIISIEI